MHHRLGDDALALLFPGLLEESGPCRELEHLADTLVGLGRALKVLGGLDVVGNGGTLSSHLMSVKRPNTYCTKYRLAGEGEPASSRQIWATYLLRGHGLLAGLAEFLNGLLVETQILLAADQDLGDVGAEVMYF